MSDNLEFFGMAVLSQPSHGACELGGDRANTVRSRLSTVFGVCLRGSSSYGESR